MADKRMAGDALTNIRGYLDDQISSAVGNGNSFKRGQYKPGRKYGRRRPSNQPTENTEVQQGSNNSPTDTSGTRATMAGFFAPNDSHLAVSSRIKRNQDLNATAQQKYSNTSSIAQNAINNASNNAYIDPAALDKRIAERAEYSRAKATTMGANLFGDMNAMEVPDFQRPDPAAPVESPDFDELYDKYSDFDDDDKK